MMINRKLLLFLGVFLFLGTTVFLAALITTMKSFDLISQCVLAMVAVFGYIGSLIYLWYYLDAKNNQSYL
jgi:membrane associated rhomboid family serine protease